MKKYGLLIVCLLVSSVLLSACNTEPKSPIKYERKLGKYFEEDNKQAGGFIIQLLPNASEEVYQKLEKMLKNITSVSKLIENDICVSIGTDGASSNNNLDLIEELKTASLLQKVSTLDPKVLNSSQSLAMGTIEGAKALGLDSEIGSIEVGKKADIILIDTNSDSIRRNIVDGELIYPYKDSDEFDFKSFYNITKLFFF